MGRRVGVPTCPVTAQHLQAHSYSCWGPPLWVHSDVLGRNRVKPPDFRDVVVDVAFKKLQRERERKGKRCAHFTCSQADLVFWVWQNMATVSSSLAARLQAIEPS